MILDLLLLAVFAAVTWAVSSEGIWGAGIMLVNVLIAGVVAMNFFEPIAAALDSQGAGNFIRYFADFAALMFLFIGTLFVLRLLTDTLAPTMVKFPDIVYQIGRFALAALTAWLVVCFLSVALQTAPLRLQAIGFGVASNESRIREQPAPEGWWFGFTPDRTWLGFTQHASRVFGRSNVFDYPVTSFPMRYAQRRNDYYNMVGAGGGGAPVAPPSDPPSQREGPTL